MVAPTPQGAPAVKQKKPIYKRFWFWLLIIIAVCVIIGATRQGDNSSSTDQALTDQSSNSNATTTIKNGDHIVGSDLPAGVYRAEVDNGIVDLCTVSQTNSGTYMDVRNATEGSVIFTVADQAGSVVSFSGCAKIGLAADMIRANPSTITNGYWLVGDEMAPGTYQCVVDTSSIIPLGTVTQTGADGDILDIRNATEGNVIFTVQDSSGSVVDFSGCSSITQV